MKTLGKLMNAGFNILAVCCGLAVVWIVVMLFGIKTILAAIAVFWGVCFVGMILWFPFLMRNAMRKCDKCDCLFDRSFDVCPRCDSVTKEARL